MMPRILYIDDDKFNRLLIYRILVAAGYEVDLAEGAITGIDMARHNPPDLILMDMSMPEMDGLTATRHIRALPELQNVPIVVVTANVMEGDRERSLQAGSNGFIGKPIDVDRFPEQISQFMRSNS
ncbi:MAG: response regulator [Chloroflexi bacterium]|nr:response regulator [Chloroflexota bacterium]